ncbi:hypothetical protein TNIN_255701 [Trichonephila inaurata madagascariensis]|uniref:Uncharacterized protein n=1 Tax=Trichonephila inaurata madagascariensis TaxID=2747483 RepID=A0A8X6XQS2_9ARAC|nr:hypothetical protein TNIN_255701 [Trichonephila inaurata madagascariensis]
MEDCSTGKLHYILTDKETQPNIDIELNQMPDVLNAQQKYQLRHLLQRYDDIFRNRTGKDKDTSGLLKLRRNFLKNHWFPLPSKRSSTSSE